MLNQNPIDRALAILNSSNLIAADLPSVSKINNKLAINFLHRQVFLGQPQFASTTTRSAKLSQSHVKSLNAIGIEAKVGKHFHRGLVTTSTLHGPVDIIKIHQHIQSSILQIKACQSTKIAKDVEVFIQSIELCMRGEIAACRSSPELLTALRKEHDFQLSQLACILLPEDFLNSLSKPVYFVDTTGKRLGRLIQLLHQG